LQRRKYEVLILPINLGPGMEVFPLDPLAINGSRI
jgi:hypothetical protein